MPGSLVGVPVRRALEATPVIILLAMQATVAVITISIARRLGARAFLVALLAPLAALVWAAYQLIRYGTDVVDVASWTWVPALGLELTLRADGLSMLMLVIIGGVGVTVFAYAATYFRGAPSAPRVAALLAAFATAMSGLVMADNVLLLFVFWELTSVSSFLLIGTEDRQPAARAAAQQALLVTAAGGLSMLAGLVLLGTQSGTWTLTGLVERPPSGTTVSVAIGLVLVGALTKSAQVPFHAWLPGAMSAPTPVSAYLHSATMVKAGIYLVARLSPGFADVGPWRPIVLAAGLASLVLGGYRALRQHDLKLLLAFGTISQLGLLLVLFGLGTTAAWTAGVVLLLAHALFKAGLFLSVGIVDHATGTRDLRRFDRLARSMPVVVAITVVVAASMAGLPPLLGFVAKEEALSALLEPASPWRWLVLLVVAAGSMLTVAYSARLAHGLFGPATPPAGTSAAPLRHAPGRAIVVPVGVLAGLTIVFGLAPGLLDSLVSAATAWVGVDDSPHLALWHGPTAALGWSLVVLTGGALLFAARRRVERMQAAVQWAPSAQHAYERLVRDLLRTADRVTGVVQSGSLPVYLGVISLAAVTSAVPLLLGARLPDGVSWLDTPWQLTPAIVMVGAAVATTLARRRLAAVVLLGAVGYGMAAFFMIQGAPDLAVTQLLVETLTLVAFVLVLRRLPDGFVDRRHLPGARLSQAARLAVAVTVGVFVFGFALVASGERSAPPVSDEYVNRSLPDGGGRNVVNVIIVDFRGFDTLGEITVLATAALGVGALVLAGRPRTNAPRSGAPSVSPGGDDT